MGLQVTIAIEGTTDAAVIRRLLDEAGLQTDREYVKKGKSALDQSLSAYNNAARFSCWLVVRDLDQDAKCAPDLRRTLLVHPAAHMRLHIPVHSVEAWLMADSQHISEFLSVPRSKIPTDPEALPHPKRALVDIARLSRKKAIREAMVPPPGTAAVGPGYSAMLVDFSINHWRPSVASSRSGSLARLRTFLRRKAQAAGEQT